MADEVQISLNFRASKNGADISTNKQFKSNCTGAMVSKTQDITSTYELLDLGDVDAPSQLMIANLSATQTVTVSLTNSGDGFVNIIGGESAIFRPISPVLYVKSETTGTIQVLSTQE